MLYREPMWLKYATAVQAVADAFVSVLYREPMWLKYIHNRTNNGSGAHSFSALP